MNDLISIGKAIHAKGIAPKVSPDTKGQFTAFLWRGQKRPVAAKPVAAKPQPPTEKPVAPVKAEPVPTTVPTASTETVPEATQKAAVPEVDNGVAKPVESKPEAQKVPPTRKGGRKAKEVSK